jgi:hypothetical protein
MSGRGRVLVVAGIVVVAGLGGWTLLQMTGERTDTSLCRGVALPDAPVARTKRAALAAYVRSRGGDPGKWHEGDVGWEPEDRRSAQPDYASISVGQVEGGWAATGACV